MFSILSLISWSYNTLICSKSQGNNYSQRYDHRRKTKHLSLQFSSVAQSHLILCDPMDCSTPGLPVHHQLLEFIQTHVHWVGDTIQPSHPLLSRSPPAFSLSQHQILCKWVSSSHQVAEVLEFQLQYQSFQWTPRTEIQPVQGTLKSLLQYYSSKASIFWCSAFFMVQLTSVHDYWKNHNFDYVDICWQSDVSAF